MIKSHNIGSILIIVIFLLLVYLVYTYYDNSSHSEFSLRISVSEARSRIFGFIIDLRSQKERDMLGYYPNSVPISIENISKEVPLDISNKNTWILIYCNAGNKAENAENVEKAEKAAEILYRMGYPNVRYINETYNSLMPGASY